MWVSRRQSERRPGGLRPGHGRSRILCALVTVGLAVPGSMSAQEAGQPCTYETCALRLRPSGFFSTSKVVRGVQGVPVAGYRPSQTLQNLFAVEDSASAHYAVFASQYRAASRFNWLGLGLAVGGLILELRADDHPSGWGAGLLAGGYTMFFVANVPRRKAADAFSQAVWWYNRSLPDSTRRR